MRYPSTVGKFGGRLFGFEPIPWLYAKLQAEFGADERVFLVPAAVDIDDGWAWFNLDADPGMAGVASLYELSAVGSMVTSGRKLRQRLRVPKVRLESFVRQNGISRVDYLWIDAQGNDFNVLKGFGESLRLVEEGKCETIYRSDLYENTDNGFRSVVDYLTAYGFDTIVVPIGGFAEADVHFRKKPSK